MEEEDFKNIKRLYEGTDAPFILRKRSVNSDPFLISNAVHLQVRANEPGILFYKTDFERDCEEVNLNRNRRVVVSTIPNLLPLPPKLVSTKNYNNLQIIY